VVVCLLYVPFLLKKCGGLFSECTLLDEVWWFVFCMFPSGARSVVVCFRSVPFLMKCGVVVCFRSVPFLMKCGGLSSVCSLLVEEVRWFVFAVYPS
jgi:hypothetical protein